MNSYSYYTPIELARAILELNPIESVNSAIDICCGSWNLLRAANEKYPAAKIVGVDVDQVAREHQIENADFRMMDGRVYAKRECRRKKYDLILSNPPFGFLKEKDRKYKNEIGDKFYTGLLNHRYENEMMQANLLLAHRKSTLVFILPNTFFEGDSALEVRKELAKDFHIKKLIKLPSDTFDRGRINTFVLIMNKKNKNDEKTELYSAEVNDNVWKIEKETEVDNARIISGEWIRENKKTCIGIDLKIARGNVSSKDFLKQGELVLHSSTGNQSWKPSKRCIDLKVKDNYTIADTGDILINRVGKGAGYWCVNEYHKAIISDCLLVVKSDKIPVGKIFTDNSHQGRLNIPIRGVSTQYITAKDVKELICKNKI